MENNNSVNDAVNKVNEMVDNGVLFSILAYVPFLWLLGLLIAPAKDSSFVKGHVNNGIIITIVGLIAAILGKILSIIPILGGLVGGAIGIIFLVLMIMGIYKAATKQAFLLPVIGDSIKIVK